MISVQSTCVPTSVAAMAIPSTSRFFGMRPGPALAAIEIDPDVKSSFVPVKRCLAFLPASKIPQPNAREHQNEDKNNDCFHHRRHLQGSVCHV